MLQKQHRALQSTESALTTQKEQFEVQKRIGSDEYESLRSQMKNREVQMKNEKDQLA